MTTITSPISKEKFQVKSVVPRTSIVSRYMDFAARQEKERMLWYLKAIMVLSCAVMVPSIFLMALVTPFYLWFVGLSMLLFFTNIIIHIGQAKSTVFVLFYHATIVISYLIPFITYLLN